MSKTPNENREDFLSVLEAEFAANGKEIDIKPGSQFYMLAEAVSNLMSVEQARIDSLFQDSNESTATGEALDRHLDAKGLSRRPSIPAVGSFILVSSGATNIPNGTQLVSSSSGELYVVTNPGSKLNGDRIHFKAVKAGRSGNLRTGSVLKWTTNPSGVGPLVNLNLPVSGGADLETDDLARERLKAVIRDAAGGKNWAEIIKVAESFDPIVRKAFCYPIIAGAGTVHVALAGAASDVSVSRMIDVATLSQLRNAIIANTDSSSNVHVTGVVDYPVDISFNVNLPYPQGSNIRPTGGGFLNINTYPVRDDGASFCNVTSVVGPNVIVIKAMPGADPTVNLSKVSWIDPITFRIFTSTVVAHSGVGNAHTITLSDSFNGIAIGDWIFPAIQNIVEYVNTLKSHFENMGCGEKTNAAGVLPRASRKPLPSQSNPYMIDDYMLKALTDSHREMFNAEFAYRSKTEPPLPWTVEDGGSILNPPNIFVPRKFAFYPKDR